MFTIPKKSLLHLLVLISIYHIEAILHRVVHFQLVHRVVRPQYNWNLVASVKRDDRGKPVPIIVKIFTDDVVSGYGATSYGFVPFTIKEHFRRTIRPERMIEYALDRAKQRTHL